MRANSCDIKAVVIILRRNIDEAYRVPMLDVALKKEKSNVIERYR